jgi:hypothetical protein
MRAEQADRRQRRVTVPECLEHIGNAFRRFDVSTTTEMK